MVLYIVVRIVYIQIHTTMSQNVTTYQYVPHLYVSIRTNTWQQPNTYVIRTTFSRNTYHIFKYVPLWTGTPTYMYIHVHICTYMYIVLSFVSSSGPHPTIWYRMFAVLAGLCFLHPTSTLLHGETIQIRPIHWQVLVRTSGLGVQNTRAQRGRYSDGMHLCNDGNLMGLLPARSQAMVAKYSSDRIQDALSAEAQPIYLDCANHQHLGSPAPGSSWPERNNPSQYACKAAGMLRVWRVWQGWWAWHWQPGLPYQFVGNVLSIRSSSAVSVNPASGFWVAMKWLMRLRWLAMCVHQSLPYPFD